MLTEKLKELQALRARAVELEAEVEAEQTKILADLHTQYGFSSPEAFIAAIRKSASGASGKEANSELRDEPSSRRRAKITDETRAEVKKLVGEGKTGQEIASTLRISLPSVQNIKRTLGLVKRRSK